LGKPDQVAAVAGVELHHAAWRELVVGADQAPLRALAIRRMSRKIDTEERPLVLAAASVRRRHPASHKNPDEPLGDDLDADRHFVDLLALHPPDDREQPMIALLDRDELAQAGRRILDRRGEAAAGVAAVDDLPNRSADSARDRFRVDARIHDLRDFVETGRHTRCPRRIGQTIDLGHRASTPAD
jgi:hypothetical protein